MKAPEGYAFIVAIALAAYVFVTPVLPSVEGRFFPVASRAELTEVEDWGTDGWSKIAGTADKLRDCDFLAVKWFLGSPSGRAQAQVQFLETTKHRAPGSFSFGPWAVQLTPSQIRDNSYAVVTHQCHVFWETRTILYSSRE